MRTALLLGFSHHVHAIAGFVNKHASGWHLIPHGASRSARNRALALLPFVDAVAEFGGPAPDALIAAAARRLHKPTLVIWAGTDVLRLRDAPETVAKTRAQRHRHAACSETLAAELRDLGIDAVGLRLAVAAPPANPLPLPERFSVLAYSVAGSESLYGFDLILQAAARLPDAHFDIIGCTEPPDCDLANVSFHGWIDDVDRAVNEATVVLRPTRHDGMPLMVVDSLARGRYVIWSYPLEGAIHARELDEIVSHLGTLQQKQRDGSLGLNLEGMQAVQTAFSPQAVTAGVEAFFNELVASHEVRFNAPRKRAVVSGEADKVAHFIEQAAREAPEWDFHPLLGGSRGERLDHVLSIAASKKWFNLGKNGLDPLTLGAARVFRKKLTTIDYIPGTVLNGTLHPRRGRKVTILSAKEWRAFDACHPAPTFFARPAWGMALERAFDNFSAEARLFNLPEGEAVFPFIRSGRRFKSIEAMPLGTYTVPLRPDGEPADERLAAAIVREMATSSDDFCCTLWPLANYNGGIDTCDKRPYEAAVIDLRDGAEAALARWKGVARRMAGQAVRKGVTVGVEQGAMDIYYGLLEDAAKRWGLEAPHIPRSLFDAVLEFGGNDVEVWIARYRGEAIAGGVMLYGSREAFFWSAALRGEYGHLRPSNLLNTEMIKAAAERGIQWYNMGASEGLEGVARFKESLGAELHSYAMLTWRSPLYRKYCQLRSFLRRSEAPARGAMAAEAVDVEEEVAQPVG